MENKNIKIILENNAHNNYRLLKLEDSETLQRNANTKRFCDIIAKNWVLLNKATRRIENDKNPRSLV